MNLKPVSYAVLGQLAFRPWAAYALIKEMQRNVHYFYPRAESGLYEELKKLERQQLATSHFETKGKKERAVYTITDKGRELLKTWLASEPEHFKLEFDGLLRVFLSKFGEAAHLQHSLAKVRSDSSTLVALAEKIANEYLEDKAPAQPEIVQRALVFDFLLHYGMLYTEWLDRSEAYLAEIKDLPAAAAEQVAKNKISKAAKKFGLRVGNEGGV